MCVGVRPASSQANRTQTGLERRWGTAAKAQPLRNSRCLFFLLLSVKYRYLSISYHHHPLSVLLLARLDETSVASNRAALSSHRELKSAQMHTCAWSSPFCQNDSLSVKQLSCCTQIPSNFGIKGYWNQIHPLSGWGLPITWTGRHRVTLKGS